MIYIVELTVKCPLIVWTQTTHETRSHVKKCNKETNSGLLESEIGICSGYVRNSHRAIRSIKCH